METENPTPATEAPSQPSPSSAPNPAESQSQPTQPTSQPTNPPTKSQYETLLEEGWRQQNAQLQALRDENARLQAAATQARPPEAGPQGNQRDPAAFFNDPHGELDRRFNALKDDMRDMVAPLNQFVAGYRSDGSPYAHIKSQLAARYSILNNPKVSAAVDKILEGQQNITAQLMEQAVVQAAGMHATGTLDAALLASGVDISRFNEPTPMIPRVTPPYTPPTPPAAPVQQPPTAEVQPLNELEKRIMREQGFKSEAEFRQWASLTPNQVASAQIGRTQK